MEPVADTTPPLANVELASALPPTAHPATTAATKPPTIHLLNRFDLLDLQVRERSDRDYPAPIKEV
jgi:hypothetical protein